MKNIKYLLLLLTCFVFVGVVKAEDISMDALIEKIKANGPSAEYSNGKLVVSSSGNTFTFDYDESTNVISYVDNNATDVKKAITGSSILKYIAAAASNGANYKALTDTDPELKINLGNGCDLDNMGMCFEPETKKVQFSLSDKFTTYVINQYNSEDVVDNDDSMAKAIDPNQTESTYGGEGEAPTQTQTGEQTTGDAKNPTTGSFAEYGLIIGLVLLLLVVIILKKRNETEYDL